MAVILNASTSSGLVTTADNSGQFAFQSNGTQFNPLLTSGTVQNSTSGTSIDFTGIPSWVKRITVIFNGVSGSGSSSFQMQLGAGSIVTTGYTSSAAYVGVGSSATTSTTGLLITFGNGAVNSYRGIVMITNISGNNWVHSGNLARDDGYQQPSGGSISLSGTLDRVRITTVNGTDTFDAGTINIMYE